MKEELIALKSELAELLERVNDLVELNDLRAKFLGKKGKLTAILRRMGELPQEERPFLGQLANKIKEEIEFAIEEKNEKIKERIKKDRLEKEKIDVTVPTKVILGHRHPLSIVLNDIIDFFYGLGYEVVEGPEVEWDYYNFEALNIPKDHPARDLQDTFYITDEILLRTHTSPVQIRTMERNKPPIKVIVPGRVFRSDAVDATHSPVFHQVEGLVIGEDITMADLKGTLTAFAKAIFGEERRTRFRPSFFPFTEPSAEMDISCISCNGKGCRLCSYTGWIEILGCGMVHPNVIKNGGYDPEKFSGFAFGMGLERIALLKYNIDDMRLLFENDLRFLSQF
ncbi:MAG: phenylalanine--tRNA ligase subunit alpha [Thermovenabulum sp.]|uniref:phenylalanine--tRNA ligase subunit alpha n=1 Tax=Thermovenabulum sp. TaxID=3100335 RepID=UPI003C7AFC0C